MTTLQTLHNFIRPHRRAFLTAVLLTIVVTVISLIPPMLVRTIVDRVIGQREARLLTWLVVLVAVTPLLAGVLRLLGNYLITFIGARCVLDMRKQLYTHLVRMPLSYYDRSSTGVLMERLMGDTSQVQRMVTQQTVTLISDVFTALLALVAMFYLNSRLAMIPLLFVPVYVLTHVFFLRRVRVANELYRNKMDAISGTMRERLHSTAIVKAFGQEANETRRFQDEAWDAQEYGVQAHAYSIAFNTSANLLTWSARIGVLLLGYYMVIERMMTLGEVVAFGTYAMFLLGPAVRFAQMSNVLEQAMVSVRRIGEMLSEVAEDPAAGEHPGDAPPAGEVVFQDVCFEYEPDQPVLRHIDLHVPPGATVALVGHTGCGKTTLVSLLYRFYDPTSGRILLDGNDITRMPRWLLRQRLALVPQDAVVFEGTVAENIAYGCRNAPPERIIAAARVAELYDVIMEMPDGFDTKLGGEDAKLSVGQKQRLMVARAIVPDPAVLVLDEATSSLDGQSERALQEAMDRVMQGRTSFVIAHRLSTIVNADMIVVLDAGRVIEVGSHAELMARPDSSYRSLYTRQFTQEALGAHTG